MVFALNLAAEMEIAESPNLTDTSNSESSEAESDSYDSETGGPPGLLPAGQVDDSELSEEDSGTTSDYGSREGEVEDDLVVEEDPEKIRKAGNDLFNAENIEGALEKYKEAIACGERGSQMSAESLGKTYSNIAHCYNKKKKYEESIEASFNSMEANKTFVRPYLRVAHSYKMLENYNMSALALMKAKAMPITTEQQASTVSVQAIKAEIVRELAEVADEAKVAARDYMQRRGINNACKLDLQAARAARFGEKSKQAPTSSPPCAKTNNVGRTFPKAGVQPGLCGTSDQEYSTSDVDDATTMAGSRPAPAPGKHAPPPPPLANGTSAVSTSSEDEETRPSQERKKKTKKTASKQTRLMEETKKKLDEKTKEEMMEKRKAAEREKEEEEERKRKAAEKLKKEKEAKAEKLREEQEKQRKAEEEENRRKVNERLRSSSAASQQLHLKLSEANSAFKNNTMERSLEQYSQALDIINSDWSQLGYRTSKESSVMVVVVKYQFARSCSETGLLKNLTTAHNVFTDILKGTHKEVKFPAVYLGFGMLYKRLNRHERALDWVEKGVKYLDQGLPCPPSTWPGGSDRLPDTDETLLRKALMALRQEMKCPPRPKAVCKYRDCLRVQGQLYPDEPFIPRDNEPFRNIYLTDPDLQCFVTVVCRNDCKLDFHSPCWDEKKVDFLHVLKASKSPSERDFCGQPCFTPDCGSLIVKILITDSYNEVKVVDNKKILQEIEEEERKEKELERRQKEQEEEERKRLKHQEKLKKLEKKNKERTPTSSEKEVVTAEKSEASNIQAQQFADPAAFIPLDSDNVTVLKKQRDVEPEEKVKKTKKSKEKTLSVLSLGEFNGEAQGDGPELHGDHQERLARLACIKRNVEEQQNLPPIHYSMPRTDPANLKAQIDSYLGREPVSVESVVVESIKSDVLQKLKQLGPLKEGDQRLVVNLSQEGRRLVMDKKGMINFLKNDERFGSYSDYVCLKGEAERAKQLHENEAEEKPKNNLGDLARKMRLELELGEKKKREQEALVNAKKDEEEKVVKDAEVAEEDANQQAANLSPSQCQECQTDWDMAALHSLEGDPLALQRSNAKLSAEAQELKDKMYKLQNERKVEVNELSDKLRTLKVENTVMKEEVKENKAKVAKMEVAYKEGLKRDEELKKIKDSLVLKSGNLDSTQSQLNKAQQKLAKETELSFELQQKFHKEKERRENEVRLLKLKLLKDQHETINAHLLRRKAENEANMAYLSTMDRTGKSSLLERLNEFSAKLIHAIDVLKSKYEEAVAGVNATTSGTAQLPARLDLDLVGLEAPTLTAQEADALRLLAMAGLASVGLNSAPARASPSPFPPVPLRAPHASGFPAPPQNNFPGPPPPIGLPGTPLLRPPPGMLRSTPTVADQLAAVAPQANVRPASTTMSRAPGGPVGTPRPPQPPIGTAPRAPAPVNLGSKAPGGPTNSASRPTSRGASGPSPSIPDPLPPAPVGGATASAAGPSRGGKKSSHEKLIEKLGTRYPQLSTDDLSRYINKLRERNSGKLSGMSVASIEQQVGALMVQFPPMNPPPQASASALADQDSNNCAVCLEEMFDHNSKRLNPCGHRFHHHCINEWMHTHGGAGNTCPMCRVYITREDEFPDLGHNPHRRH